MRTLNYNKSRDLFNKLIDLRCDIQNLAATVQNPDFVNEDNAQEVYTDYYNISKDLKRKLADISDEILDLFRPLIEEDI